MGETPGRLSVAGLGPGGARHLTPEVRDRLEEARAVAGYTTYLGLIDPALLEGKKIISSGMTREVKRCAEAIEAAASGLDTVLVSSGDPGVYGMAGLVLEMLEERGLLESLDWEVLPGLPALSAASALLGAPLMHDFAVISLSDLLTPWETIEKRLEAAASADFVLVLYNPRSKKRPHLLRRALDIAGRHLPPETPVGHVRAASREKESVWRGTLATVDPARVDMLSLLVLGNSSTRLLGRKGSDPEAMVTPRGYREKYDLAGSEGDRDRREPADDAP